jgi:hypothetical protein
MLAMALMVGCLTARLLILYPGERVAAEAVQTKDMLCCERKSNDNPEKKPPKVKDPFVNDSLKMTLALSDFTLYTRIVPETPGVGFHLSRGDLASSQLRC